MNDGDGLRERVADLERRLSMMVSARDLTIRELRAELMAMYRTHGCVAGHCVPCTTLRRRMDAKPCVSCGGEKSVGEGLLLRPCPTCCGNRADVGVPSHVSSTSGNRPAG